MALQTASRGRGFVVQGDTEPRQFHSRQAEKRDGAGPRCASHAYSFRGYRWDRDKTRIKLETLATVTARKRTFSAVKPTLAGAYSCQPEDRPPDLARSAFSEHTISRSGTGWVRLLLGPRTSAISAR